MVIDYRVAAGKNIQDTVRFMILAFFANILSSNMGAERNGLMESFLLARLFRFAGNNEVDLQVLIHMVLDIVQFPLTNLGKVLASR